MESCKLANKFFALLYDIALINIIKKPDSVIVYIEIHSRKKRKLSTEKTFILNDSYSDKLLFDYIKQFSEDTPFYYIATIDKSSDQGAIPTCNKHKMQNFKDLSTSQYMCIDDKWVCYTSKIDLEEQIDFMQDIGLDFLFSPFIIIKEFFKDKISGAAALYVLLQDDFITVAVFQNSQLVYGDYIDMSLEVESANDVTMMLEDESIITEDVSEGNESVDLDEIDLESDLSLDNDFDDIDDFDNIEDLDNIDDMGSDENLEMKLEENLEEISEEQADRSEKEAVQEEKMTQDFQRFSLIQNSLARFYKDERYESEFIENIYVADSVRVTNDFKTYLQDEMFLNVYMRNIEIELEVAALAKEEVGLA